LLLSVKETPKLKFAFSALSLLVGWQEGHSACKKTEWWGAGLVICLERDADLHMAQLMPLPLIVSCFSKIQIRFTFLAPAHPGSPGQRAVKRARACRLLVLEHGVSLAIHATYVVAGGEYVSHVLAHAGVVDRHEGRVEYDTQRDEQVDEGIHDEELDDVSEALPAVAALPVEQQLLNAQLEHLLDAQLASEPLTRDACTIRYDTIRYN